MPKEEGGLAFNPISPCATAWPPSWCDSCRAVPCSVYCRADAAYLCGSCDTSIHSANTLAGRHHRVPVLPIQAGGFIFGGISAPPRELAKRTEEQEGEEDGFLIEEEVDEYLDLVEFSSGEEEGKGEVKEKQNGCDECEREVDVVVPVQCLAGQGAKKMMVQSFQFEYEGFAGGIDYSTAASSVDHNVSVFSNSSSYQLLFKRSTGITVINGNSRSNRRRHDRYLELSQYGFQRDDGALLRPHPSAATHGVSHGQRGQGSQVQGEEEDPKVPKDYPVRVEEGLRRDEATDQGPICQAKGRRRRSRSNVRCAGDDRDELRRRPFLLEKALVSFG